MQLKIFTQSIIQKNRDNIEEAIRGISSTQISSLGYFNETKAAAIALATSLLNTRDKLQEELSTITREDDSSELEKKLTDFATMVNDFLEKNTDDTDAVEATLVPLIAFTQKMKKRNITDIQHIIDNLSRSPLMTVESVNLIKKIAVGLAIVLFLITIVVGLHFGTGELIFPLLLGAGSVSAGIGFFAPSKHKLEHEILKTAKEMSLSFNAI